MMTKRRNLHLDVLHGASESGHLQVSPTDRCILCPPGKNKIRKDDAAIRIRDFADVSMDPIMVHRRCMENVLGSSVDDRPKMRTRFQRYRDDLADDYEELDLDPV